MYLSPAQVPRQRPVWVWCSVLLGSIAVGWWELRLGGLVQLTFYDNYLDFVRWSWSFQIAGWIWVSFTNITLWRKKIPKTKQKKLSPLCRRMGVASTFEGLTPSVFFCCVKMNEHFLVVLSSKAFILTPCRYLSFLFQIQQSAKSTRRWTAANQPLFCSLPARAFISWYLPLYRVSTSTLSRLHLWPTLSRFPSNPLPALICFT